MKHTELIRKPVHRIGETLKEKGSKLRTYFVFGLQHTIVRYNHRKYIVVEQDETIKEVVYNNLIIK